MSIEYFHVRFHFHTGADYPKTLHLYAQWLEGSIAELADLLVTSGSVGALSMRKFNSRTAHDFCCQWLTTCSGSGSSCGLVYRTDVEVEQTFDSMVTSACPPWSH